MPPQLAPHRLASIYRLPPGVTSLDDPGWHYHVLMRECDRGAIATLAWGSSQNTQANAGAAHHIVKPHGVGIRANHLKLDTYFYGGILVLCPEPELTKRTGTAIDHLTALRRCLHQSLGIGTGVGNASGVKGSRRGQIVATQPSPFIQEMPFTRAVVLTQHKYSAEGQYQIIVPIVPGGVGVEVGLHVVRRAEQAWIPSSLGAEVDEALFPATLAQSVWQSDSIDARVKPEWIDDYALKRVEEELCAYFRLHDGAAKKGAC